MKFCIQLKSLSCKAMGDWWNQGVDKKSLCTYCFFVKCYIAFGPCGSRSLFRICWEAYFCSIQGYEFMFHFHWTKNFLIWKFEGLFCVVEASYLEMKITEKLGCNIHLTIKKKMKCCTDSITIVNTIVANVCHANLSNLYGQWRIPIIIWYLKTIKIPILKSI